MSAEPGASVVEIAERYYDSNEADEFYFSIWGGEDIHIGLYQTEDDSIAEASHRTVQRMASHLGGVGAGSRVLDLGAGYGGAGRYLARGLGCHVTCLNLSRTQNARNEQLTREQGLSERVDVVYGNFESVPAQDSSYDAVWSQDAILHSGNRAQVLREARRVLRPGGLIVFTDPMQADDCPAGVLGPVLARIHLESLGSFAFYREQLAALEMVEVAREDLTEQLVRHYAAVRRQLTSRYDEMVERSTKPYVDRMIEGLGHWVEAGQAGYLAWGILVFRAP